MTPTIKYILTSDRLEGNLIFGYSEAGMLVQFENNAEMTPELLQWFLERFNYTLTAQSLRDWAGKNKWRVLEMQEDLSFERFYNEYNVKRNRIEAERLWSRLTDQERQMVLANHKAYVRYCRRNLWYNKLYPDTYLRAHWKDEWDKI